MIQEFYDNHVFLYIMGGLCGLGVFLKCFLLVVYNKLINASESMTSTKKDWLKNMRIRFESSYQLQLGVNDVDTYVDKYVSKIKYGGLLLSTWENLSGQTIGLCLLTGSFAGILGYVYECGQGPVLFTFFAGAWTAIIVNIVDNVVNISAHKQMLRFNLIDYFENNLKVRMEQEIYHPEARRKYQNQYFLEDDSVNQEKSRQEDLTTKKAKKQVEIEEKQDKKKIIIEARAAKKKEKQEAMQAKLDAIQVRKQAKLDAIQAKKQVKLDAIQAKKQVKLDAIQAKKQAKTDKKQELIHEKRTKTRAREDEKIAKEKATIEAMIAKKNAKANEREDKEKQKMLVLKERERIENERKQKDLENNKAYKEKMRLKQEKERDAAKRREELQALDKAKELTERDNEEKVRVENTLAEISNKEEYEKQFEGMEEEEVIAMTATSKEEDMLIEEVLKDFLF